MIMSLGIWISKCFVFKVAIWWHVYSLLAYQFLYLLFSCISFSFPPINKYLSILIFYPHFLYFLLIIFILYIKYHSFHPFFPLFLHLFIKLIFFSFMFHHLTCIQVHGTTVGVFDTTIHTPRHLNIQQWFTTSSSISNLIFWRPHKF